MQGERGERVGGGEGREGERVGGGEGREREGRRRRYIGDSQNIPVLTVIKSFSLAVRTCIVYKLQLILMQTSSGPQPYEELMRPCKSHPPNANSNALHSDYALLSQVKYACLQNMFH